MHLPAATISTQVMLPLRFADGFGTTARVYTFEGLADGREHLALGLAVGGGAGADRGASQRDQRSLPGPRRPAEAHARWTSRR